MDSKCSRFFSKRLPVPLVVFWFLGGCIQEGQAPSDSISTPPLIVAPAEMERFEATYRQSDGLNVTLRLEDPIRIRDRDFVSRWAYPLLRNVQGGSSTYYLDASMRLVRIDDPCFNVKDGSCQYHLVTWTSQGVLAPYGLGVLSRVASGFGFNFSLWNVPLSAAAETKGNSSFVFVKVGRPGLALDFLGAALNPSGAYLFRQGEFAPIRISKESESDSEPSTWERIAFRTLGKFSRVADDWPMSAELPAASARKGLMFSGEEYDDFEVGISHRNAVLGFLNVSTEASDSVTNGCIVQYLHHLPGRSEAPAPEVQGTTTHYDFAAMKINEEATRWAFARHHSLTGDSFTGAKGGTYEQEGGCERASRSPWPTVSSGEFVSLVAEIPVSKQRTNLFGHYLGPWSSSNLPPEAGLDHYFLQFTPSFVNLNRSGSYIPYTIEMNANSGWLERLEVHPADVREFDGGN